MGVSRWQHTTGWMEGVSRGQHWGVMARCMTTEQLFLLFHSWHKIWTWTLKFWQNMYKQILSHFIVHGELNIVFSISIGNKTHFLSLGMGQNSAPKETRGPRGPWNAHLRQNIFKSSFFYCFIYKRRHLGGLNLKAIVSKFKSNVCKIIF